MPLRENMDSEQVHRMDLKKPRPAISTKFDGRKIASFVGDIKKELHKVEWTNKEELKTYTKVILLSTLLLGLFIYATDLATQTLLNGVHYLVKLLLG